MKKKFPKQKRDRVGTRIQQIRHTHATAAGLEDALAVAWDIVQELSRALAYAESRARRMIEILQSVRSGPHSYKEKPSGFRGTFKQR